MAESNHLDGKKSYHWKTIRIFISSTFRDMHAEREELIRRVFPELRHRCKKRKIHVEDVDLRWGVLEYQDASEICRQEVDRCRPFFLCILGERYGWIPPGAEISVTHDEIDYGVFQAKEKMHSFFYFRSPEASAEIPPEKQEDFLEPEGSVGAKQLTDLKQEICDKNLPVHQYSCHWNPEKSPPWAPEEKGCFDDLSEFANQILEDLWQKIDTLYPADRQDIYDPLEEEQEGMDYFIASRTKIFVGREDSAQELDHFIQSDKPGYLMVTGSPGSGKSALLAKFCADFSRENTLLLSHFVGASARSTSVVSLLERLCHSLQKEGGSVENYEVDLPKLCQALPELLKQVAEKRPVVILLDAVNQLENIHGAHELLWLPAELPAEVKIIISTLPGRCEAVLRSRMNPKEMAVHPFTEKERRKFIQDTLQQYGKTLDKESLAALLAKEESGNPLYLKVALEECRSLGGNEMHLKIKQITHDLPSTIPDLFANMFARLEREFGIRLIERLLSSIAVSRGGMLQRELRVILRPENLDKLPAVLWGKIYRLLEPYFLVRGDRVDFFHSQVGEAVVRRYSGAFKEVHGQIADYFGEQGITYPRTLSEYTYHLLHAEESEKLYELMIREDFVQAQIEESRTYENSYQSFGHSIEAYITGESPEDAYRLSKLMLKGGQLSFDAQSDVGTAFALARQGKMEQSLSRISGFEKDIFYKSALLFLLLEMERQEKLPKNQRNTVYLREIVQKIEERTHQKELATEIIDKAFLPWWAGKLSEMLTPEELAITISNRQLNEICQELLTRKKMDHALAMIQAIDKPEVQAKFLSEAGEQTALDGDSEKASEFFQRALKKARLVEWEAGKLEALSRIARGLAVAGRREESVKLFQEVKNKAQSRDLSFIVRDLSMDLAGGGNFSEAIQTANTISNRDFKWSAFVHISEELAKKESLPEKSLFFKQILQGIEGLAMHPYDADGSAGSLGKIGDALIQAGELDLLPQILQKSRESAGKNRLIILSVAKSLARHSNFTGAFEILKEFDNLPSWQKNPEELSEKALVVYLAGNREEALELIKESITLTEKLRAGLDKRKCLTVLAKALLQMELKEQGELFQQLLNLAGKDYWVLAGLVPGLITGDNNERTYTTLEKIIQYQIRKDASYSWYSISSDGFCTLVQSLARVERFQEAIEILQKIEYAGKKFDALASLSGSLGRAQNIPNQAETLMKVKTIIRNTDNKGFGDRLVNIIKVFATNGDFQSAMEIGKINPERDTFAKGIVTIAQYLYKQGADFHQSTLWKELTDLAINSKFSSYALEELALFFAAQKDLPSVLMILDNPKFYVEASTVLDVSIKFIESNDLAGAVEICHRIQKDSLRYSALRKITTYLLTETENIQEDGKLFPQILEIIDKMKASSQNQAKILSKMALAFTKAEDREKGNSLFEQALEIVQNSISQYQYESYKHISQDLARAGNIEKALEISHKIETVDSQCEVFATIAETLAEREDFSQAAKYIQQAQKHGITALSEIAQKLVKKGKIEKALEFANQIPKDRQRNALSAIAIALAKKKDFLQVLEILKRINYPSSDEINPIIKEVILIDNLSEKMIFLRQLLERKNDFKEEDFSLVLLILENISDKTDFLQILIKKVSYPHPFLRNLAEALAKAKKATLFPEFLERAGLSQDLLLEGIQAWQQALIQYYPDSLAPLKKSFTLFPFHYPLSFSSVLMFQAAQAGQKNWEHYNEIQRCIDEMEPEKPE